MERFSPLETFAYVNAPNAAVYRAIMAVFMVAKEQFRLHLRPGEVALELSALGLDVGEEGCESSLKALVGWGNLRSDADTADVATVEDFYRERRLYQLTRRGEAAERAVAVYEDAIRAPAELQAAALGDIREYLGQLERLARDEAPDQDKCFRTLEQLRHRFEELTQKAQTFLSGLQRAIDLQGSDEDVFVAYKERLIDYLEKFLQELIVAQREIAGAILRVEARNVGRLLEAAARREVRNRLDPDGDLPAAVRGWEARWSGLRRWFHGEAGQQPQSEMLRARGRSAITALVAAAANLHDRRLRKSDRYADLRTLALWFAQAPSDEDAHRLYRAAFTLSPARHLRTNAESLMALDEGLVDARRSWLDEPTVRLAPRLRMTGRHTRRGAPRKIQSRSAERAQLAELVAEQTRQLERARRHLLTERTRLSDLARLPRGAFQLFLDLLGEALSRQRRPNESVEVPSADGALLIRLEPVGDGSIATVETEEGTLVGPECWITIADVRERSPELATRGEAAAE